MSMYILSTRFFTIFQHNGRPIIIDVRFYIKKGLGTSILDCKMVFTADGSLERQLIHIQGHC